MSNPAGGSPSAANGSRSTGTCPSRRRTSRSSPSDLNAATAAAVSARENRTPPLRDKITGSSVTASTAENPTPNRPTATARGSSCRKSPPRRSRSSSRLAEARTSPATRPQPPSTPHRCCDDRRLPPRNENRTRPGTPARTAASAAFCASSTTTRSKVPTERQILLGVRILPKPNRRRRPARQNALLIPALPKSSLTDGSMRPATAGAELLCRSRPGPRTLHAWTFRMWCGGGGWFGGTTWGGRCRRRSSSGFSTTRCGRRRRGSLRGSGTWCSTTRRTSRGSGTRPGPTRSRRTGWRRTSRRRC